MPGALWTLDNIDALRRKKAPLLRRIVVAVDPAASNNEDSDENGIIVVGIGEDDHLYVLADVSLRGSPDEWATAAIAAYDDWDADCIVAEVNNGGDMVVSVLRSTAVAMKLKGERRSDNVAVRTVWASKGKAIRAEPISALYEQGRAHHVGQFNELEDQMSMFTIDFDRKK